MFFELVVGHGVLVWPCRFDGEGGTVAVEVDICVGRGMDMGISRSMRIHTRTGVCVGVSVIRPTRMRLGHWHRRRERTRIVNVVKACRGGGGSIHGEIEHLRAGRENGGSERRVVHVARNRLRKEEQ